MIAAMLGLERDSYYDTFGPEQSAIAISPASKLRTMDIPMLTIPTKEGDIQKADGVSGKTVIPPEKLQETRQRRTFEYVVNPVYQIDIVITDDTLRSELRERLRDGRFVYGPFLGKTECLAQIEPVTIDEKHTVSEATTTDAVESIVPEQHVTPSPEMTYAMERTQAQMVREGDRRKTTEYLSYAYSPDGDSLSFGDIPCHMVGDQPVCFV